MARKEVVGSLADSYADFGLSAEGELIVPENGLRTRDGDPVSFPFGADTGAAHASAVSLYVSTSGNDSNSGTSAAPFATLQKAFDYIEGLGAFFAGSVQINLAAGTYSDGGVLTEGILSKGRIAIRGPNVSEGTVPTAVIDGAAVGSALTYGLYFGRRSAVSLFDIKITNFSSASESGLVIADWSDIYCENVWLIDNYYNLNARTGCRIRYKGGVMSGDGYAGCLALDHCNITLGYNASTVPSGSPIGGADPLLSTDGTFIAAGVRGILWQENCQGHADYCRIETGTGAIAIAMHHASRVNAPGTVVAGGGSGDTGIYLRSSSGIAGSPTVSGCATNYDIADGWDSDKGLYQTPNLGCVALLGTDTTGGTLTANSAYTKIVDTYGVLPADALKADCKLETIITGQCQKVTGSNQMTLRLYADGSFLGAATFPTSSSYTGASLRYTCKIVIYGVTTSSQSGYFEIQVADPSGSPVAFSTGSVSGSMDLSSDPKNLSIYGYKISGDSLSVATVESVLFSTFG